MVSNKYYLFFIKKGKDVLLPKPSTHQKFFGKLRRSQNSQFLKITLVYPKNTLKYTKFSKVKGSHVITLLSIKVGKFDSICSKVT